jgi:hypothetical protein
MGLLAFPKDGVSSSEDRTITSIGLPGRFDRASWQKDVRFSVPALLWKRGGGMTPIQTNLLSGYLYHEA